MGGFLLGQVMEFVQVSRIRPSEDKENVFDPTTHAACVYTICSDRAMLLCSKSLRLAIRCGQHQSVELPTDLGTVLSQQYYSPTIASSLPFPGIICYSGPSSIIPPYFITFLGHHGTCLRPALPSVLHRRVFPEVHLFEPARSRLLVHP